MIVEYLSSAKNLTASEIAIKNYILENPNTLETISISELSENCHVGMATISRFCKKFGYKGFLEFKIAFAKEYKEFDKISTVINNEPFNENSSFDDVLTRIPYIYDKAIGFAKNALNKELLTRVVNYIDNSYVIIVGTGMNKSIADIFTYKLEELGLECKTFDSVHFQYIDALRMKKKNMFGIFLSHTGNNPSVLQAACYA